MMRGISIYHWGISKKLTTFLTSTGKKTTAQKIYSSAICLVKKKKSGDQKAKTDLFFLCKGIANVAPVMEVKKVRKGRVTHSVPSFLFRKRQLSLGIKWIIEAAREKKKNSSLSFSSLLGHELLLAGNKQGNSREKRERLLKIAEANQASLRFEWRRQKVG